MFAGCPAIQFQATEKEPTIMIKEALAIQFEDLETKQEALVIVRYDESCVVVALSHREDGDLQVVMNKEQATRLLEALQIAVK
jgi:hypothetical protein